MRHLLPFFPTEHYLSLNIPATSTPKRLKKMDTVFQFQKSLDNKIAELESIKNANGVQGDSLKNEEDIFDSVGKCVVTGFSCFQSSILFFAQNH